LILKRLRRSKEVKVTDTVAIGDSVAHVAISPDGTKALAVKPVVNKVAFLILPP